MYHCACGCDRWSGLSCVFVWRRQREGQWLRGSGNMARTEPSWRQLFRGIQKLFYPFTGLRRGVTIMFISWLYRGNYFIASTQFLEQPNFKLVIAEDFDWYLIYFRIFVGACQSMSMSCIFLKTHWLQLWPELRLVWQTHWSAAGTYLPFANRLLPLIDIARSFEANQITSKIINNPCWIERTDITHFGIGGFVLSFWNHHCDCILWVSHNLCAENVLIALVILL